MKDVVMRQESSDNTLSVKELDVVLPRYQPFNGYTSPPLHHTHYDHKGCWAPAVKYLHPPDEDELKRQMELDKKEPGFAAAVLPPDNPAPEDGLMSPSYFDYLPPSQIVYRRFDFPPFSPRPITYPPPTPGGHVPTITYEPRNDALHAVPLPCSKKIAEDTGVLDTLSVDELFKGNMPDWLPDDTSKLLQYYERWNKPRNGFICTPN